MKKLIITGWLALVCMIVSAQVDLDSAKAELYRVNKVFDTTLFLGFDVNITYSSDTIYGRFAYEQLDGSYILNNRNIYYRMGNTEYIQNDSFVYNIYHDEKLMMMTKDMIASKSNLFPLREFVDSILTWYDTAYVISMEDAGDVRGLVFVARYDSLPYQRFAIYYEEESYFPERFEMKFFDQRDESDTVFLISDTTIARPFNSDRFVRHIEMSFQNYHYPTAPVVFADSNYVYFNRRSRKYQPAEKFRGYRFIANGVEAESEEDATEIYPPPGE